MKSNDVMDFNCFNKVIPSLRLITEPTKLLDIKFKDRLLFVNKDTYMTLCYYHPKTKQFLYKYLYNKITTESLLFDIRSAFIPLSYEFDINELVIEDILCDILERKIIVKLKN